MINELCGCGKPVRYYVCSNDLLQGSCNKYSRCLSYSELEKLAQKRKELIDELLEACEDLHSYRSGRKHYEDAVVKYQQIEQLRQEYKL